VDIEQFARMADHDLLVALREHVPELGERIERRNLFKRALWAELADTPAHLVDISHAEERAAERDIAERAGVDETAVIVDVPRRPSMKESNARVLVGGVVQRLEEASGLVGAIRSAQRGGWRLGVFAPASERGAVGDAAVDVLGLPERVRR